MTLGWGIVVIVFVLGVIVGAVGLGTIAIKIAMARDPKASEALKKQIEKNHEHIKNRISRIKDMKAEVEEMKKMVPRPIPDIRSLKCNMCEHEWRTISVIGRCPHCDSMNSRHIGIVTETPFIGEPS